MLSKQQVQARLPQVGETLTRAPTTSLDHGHGANRPQECVVVEVNAAKLWYRVRFANGFSECYRALEG